jgi:hypothetical protein
MNSALADAKGVPNYWWCLRCSTWTQVDNCQLCAECAKRIEDLFGRGRLLPADLCMFDGEEP